MVHFSFDQLRLHQQLLVIFPFQLVIELVEYFNGGLELLQLEVKTSQMRLNPPLEEGTRVLHTPFNGILGKVDEVFEAAFDAEALVEEGTKDGGKLGLGEVDKKVESLLNMVH